MNTKKSSKIFAVGDVHGCYKTMMALMKKLPIDRKKDTVVFLGDYVDRGPRSKQVIDRLMKWQEKYPHWRFLMGNHEDLMLDALLYKGQIYHSYDLWYNQGGLQTARSYFPPGFSKYDMAISQPKDHIKWKHLNWMRDRDIYYETDDYFFVHGGIPPGTSIEMIKSLLLDGGLTNPVRQSMLWARDEFIFSKYDWGKKIIFGHSADYDGKYACPPGSSTFEPIVRKNKIGIDCAVCPPARNKLCALQLPKEKFYFKDCID